MTSRSVAGRLGHANPAMTLRVYAHAVTANDQAVASTLAHSSNPDHPPIPAGASTTPDTLGTRTPTVSLYGWGAGSKGVHQTTADPQQLQGEIRPRLPSWPVHQCTPRW